MTVAPAAERFKRAEWASAFRNVEHELSAVPVKPSRGTVPAELLGTLYRNGPGRLERAGQRVHHPFDGDGMITALRFDAGGVSLTNRFVRTAGWQAEEAAGKVLYRGVFGSQKPGGRLANAFDLRLKNIANTGVIRLGDQLLALWEAAEPHALDPHSLDTHGICLLGGVLKKGEAFSAHPRFDPGHHDRPRMVTFGVNTGPRSTIRLMEFATEDDAAAGIKAGDLLDDRRDTFGGFAFLHDFAITPNWAVFLQNAVDFNPLPFVLGEKGAAQCLRSNPNGQAKFWLIPRDSGAFAGQAPRIIDAPDGFVFHHLNAWEEGSDVVVDSIYYSDFPSIGPDVDFAAVDFDLIPEGLLEQCRIHLDRGAVETTRLSERCCEFAMVNPEREGLPCRFAWMAAAARKQGNDPLQVIKKLNLSTGEHQIWSAAPHGFVSEPLMVPRPGASSEDDGWILELVWNGARDGSDLVILDASDLRELAVLELPLAIPHGLHGSWVAAG
ncbi:carotenoid oxygenase family protein [Synechococcus sp. A15-60]|uniref:carotenoid oxygenase family protein n=1 Tax=Synechococcus sp. A15-60 TaxID=1050655 RepID=UPI001645EC73|nr:carotenoid oxygenase family protein [Synechococcus sp. A15-60]QNI46992.1 apocarotenoid-15/15'-oxygenase [Synechococcus sp. A15-60]